MSAKRAPRAIDLYSGVGGWSLGLRLAGIDVVASYEIWGPGNETNFKNNHHPTQTADIRRLSFSDLPDQVDFVVGSPPCTQFSFSNRGGNGDLEDGLEDIITFLKIVDHLKPKAWAMENVPRVARIIEKEMEPHGRLKSFSHLGLKTHVLNMEDYGLPQRRKRCIAGNFNSQILLSYAPQSHRLTLGDVVNALSQDPVRDPLYDICIPKSALIDHIPEAPLNQEELRINQSNKTAHTVYNAMSFPDPLDRAARTVTATCTRVSRESIIIAPPDHAEGVRRLTVRERASLQGFPITFQFYGTTYTEKLRMVGNAVPPAFSYLMGHVFQGTKVDLVPQLDRYSGQLSAPSPAPVITPPHRPGTNYPPNRSFRFAIQSLQLKSGVRFELRNRISDVHTEWSVDFYFGTSKNILELQMDSALLAKLLQEVPRDMRIDVDATLSGITDYLDKADLENMQRVWSHRGVGGTRPFMLLDELDRAGAHLIKVVQKATNVAVAVVETAIAAAFGTEKSPVGFAKLERNAPVIAAGLLIGSAANKVLAVRKSTMMWRRANATSH